MPINYALASINEEVVAEASDGKYDVGSIARLLLKKIPSHDHKMTYTHENYNIHNVRLGKVIVLCAADTNFKQRSCFAFLNEIAQKLKDDSTSVSKSSLKARMDYYSDPGNDKLTRVQGQVEEVKGVMLENIDKVLQRGEKLDTLVDKTEALNEQASVFQKKSKDLKRTMWCKNMKLNLVIFGVIAIVIIIVVVIAVKKS